MRKILVLWVLLGWIGLASAADEAVVTYSSVPLTRGAKELQSWFNAQQLALLEKLNRADIKHLARQAQVMVPSDWQADELAFSPLPAQYPAAADFAKLIVVEQAQQVFGAYENGRLVHWGPVSTGRKTSPTPPGMYALNWRSTGRHSTVNRKWFLRWYFNFDSRRGLSLHEFELPGLPESHSCVRLLARDARWVYDWGQEWQLDAMKKTVASKGTPLWVIGEYQYAAPKPWLTPTKILLPEAIPAS